MRRARIGTGSWEEVKVCLGLAKLGQSTRRRPFMRAQVVRQRKAPNQPAKRGGTPDYTSPTGSVLAFFLKVNRFWGTPGVAGGLFFGGTGVVDQGEKCWGTGELSLLPYSSASKYKKGFNAIPPAKIA